MVKFKITVLFLLAIGISAWSPILEVMVNPVTLCSGLQVSYSVHKSGGSTSVSISLSMEEDNDDFDQNDQGDDRGNDDIGDDRGDENENTGTSDLDGTIYEGATFYYVFYDENGNLLSQQFESNTASVIEPGTYYCTVVGPEGCKATTTITVK